MRRKVLWATLAACVAAYIPLTIWGLASRGSVDLAVWVWIAGVVPLMLAAGMVMVIMRPGNPIGELALWSGITMFLLPMLAEVPTTVIHAQSGVQEWMWAAMWLAMTSGMIGFVLLMNLVVTLPNGQIQHARERRFLSISWVTVALPTLGLFTNELVHAHTQSFVGVDDVPSPFFIPALEPVGPAVIAVGDLIYALFFWAVGLQVLRYRHASARKQKQVRWVLFGGVVALGLGSIPSMLDAVGIIGPLVHGSLGSMIIVPVLLIFMGSVVIAVVEPPWADVDIAIRKSFVYGALSFLILVLYVGAASAFGVAAGARLEVEIAIVLTVVVALLFQPARRRLQVVADRWVFGVRPTKYQAVTEFGETIEQAADPTELLPQLVDTIGRALSLTWVSAELDDGTSAHTGDRRTGDPVLTVRVRAGEENFGSIACGPKTEGALDPDEQQLVRTLAGQVGLAVMNARLAGRIVTAAESERRRIERNIHDGAQQELVALVARLGMARAAASEGSLSPEDVEVLQREARQILADLRELAQGIHPSVLGDGGILEAIEERCSHLPINVIVDASDSLRSRRYGDDIEGAAYFFVTEALTNVLKHADATEVTVSMSQDAGRLRLAVFDDGCGFDASGTTLNGLAGLTDRVRALGGTVTVSSRAGSGTRVEAALPAER